MIIKMGEKIKAYRVNKGLSQEKFGEYLGVSEQIVAKWESGNGYPDVELIPMIANYFEISTDELLCVESLRNEDKIFAYLDKFQQNISIGKINECIQLMRDGLTYFPNNYKFMCMLMYSLYISCNRPSEIKHYSNEIVELSERILANCTDDDIRLEAKRLLYLHYYDDLKDVDKAIEVASTLPSRVISREDILPYVSVGAEKLYLLQENIMAYLELLVKSIKSYTINRDSLTNKEKIAFYEMTLHLYKLIYFKSDYHTGYTDLIDTNKKLAVLYTYENDVDKALNCLESAAVYSASYDDLPEVTPYMSPLVNMLSFDKNKVDTDDACSKRKIFMDDFLKMECYDALRYNERIKKIWDIVK